MSDIQAALEPLRKIVDSSVEAHDLRLPRLSYRRAAIKQRLESVNEHIYASSFGYLFGTRSYARSIKACHSVAIYVALSKDAVDMCISRKKYAVSAALVMPMASRTVVHHGSGFVCAMLNPTHPRYRQFAAAPLGSLSMLDRDAFVSLNESLRQVCLGTLDSRASRRLHSRLIALAAENLPIPPPLDARVATAIKRLRINVNQSLENLASEVGLSYFRLSHLFSGCIGLSLRSYQLWLKFDRAWRLMKRGHSIAASAAGAGFSDSERLCHAFQDVLGVSPARYLRHQLFASRELTPVDAAEVLGEKREANEGDKQ